MKKVRVLVAMLHRWHEWKRWRRWFSFFDRATLNRTIFILDPFPFIYLDPPFSI